MLLHTEFENRESENFPLNSKKIGISTIFVRTSLNIGLFQTLLFVFVCFIINSLFTTYNQLLEYKLVQLHFLV